jgi:hypothetical protein
MATKLPFNIKSGTVHWGDHPMNVKHFNEALCYVNKCMSAMRDGNNPTKALITDCDKLFKILDSADAAVAAFQQTLLDYSKYQSINDRQPNYRYKPKPSQALLNFFMPLDQKNVRSKYLLEFRRFEQDKIAWEARRIAIKSGMEHLPDGRSLDSIRSPNFPKFGNLPGMIQRDLKIYLNARDEYALQHKKWRLESRNFNKSNPDLLMNKVSQIRQFEAQFNFDQMTNDVKSLRARLECFRVKGPFGVQRISWKVLPAGLPISDAINHHLKEIKRRHPSKFFDEERLKNIASLKPVKCIIGSDEFDGYIVFFFKNCLISVLECPWKNNALYLLNANKWATLSKLSKSELLSLHSNNAQRIVHDDGGSWFPQLKKVIISNTKNSTKS